MAFLTRRHTHREGAIRASTARQQARLALVARATQTGLAQVDDLHQQAASMAAHSLRIQETLIKMAVAVDRLTPDQEAAIQRLTEQYLADMLTFTKVACDEIIDTISAP